MVIYGYQNSVQTHEDSLNFFVSSTLQEHCGALSIPSHGVVARQSSSRYWELSAASRESSGNHFRSDPVRVQSTLLIFP